MPDLHIGDVTLHYAQEGVGPPLLLIAGMISDGASWAPLLPLLEPHFTVIRPDMRTTGQTTPWNAPASIPLFAQDCAALLAHLGLGPAHVMGHSLGGMIGWELARAYPAQVRSLTLAASAPLRLERNVALFKTLAAIRTSNAAPDVWLRALFPWLFAPALFEAEGAIEQAVAAALAYPFAQTPQAMAHQIAALDGYAPDATAPPTCPIQSLLAQDDLIMPAALAQTVLGEVQTHMVPHAGHSIHWDAPDAVAAHLIRFTSHQKEPS
ncbi:alpha/beta fold hydrolase [uncultured Sulfitobacter sp.]|uniref:alpha/beta fold hydrolase n=1 Tax=uncultured Sulfitobacter sp. TaxID=191468 RepID=UPI00261D2891|nr:alpha/beta fold hydrolase [uncultured Sulfitobacter sp.]